MNQYLLSLCILLIWSVSVTADTNKALDEWRTFSEKTGNSNHAKWVEEISKPEAIELAKRWKTLRGYDAHDLIAEVDLPADLKAGLTIKKSDATNFPWLKKYMADEMYRALSTKEGYINSITIVPTNTYYMHAGVLSATQTMLDNGIVPKTDASSTLLNPDGTVTLLNNETASAIPYLHPKNGLELNWSYVAHGVGTETLYFDPIQANACDANGKIDREYTAVMWWQKFHGRSQIGDEKEVFGMEEFIEGGSIFAQSPYDVRGFTGVRLRYGDGTKSDDFKIYLPATNRTRTLTGTDSQDPMWAGLEISWDDWRAYWGKTNIDQFEYKLLGETLILASPEVGYVYDSRKLTDSGCKIESMELELRPVWILEITDKTGAYQYKKRTTYIDKEFYYMQYHVTTDQRDNVFRTWEDSRAWRPSDGDSQWRHITIHNEMNNRINIIDATAVWEGRAEEVTEEQFDVDQLRDYQ